ncbi:MAG: 30S ribosomal protein S4e [Marine Group II euryarchaeote MED-G33]|nr:MAG: 30S ribosomal protein S4e [Marine Group II euryarchaeote MED-G33]
MSSSHMKRLAMPRSWPLTRKTDVWISRPRPSGHPIERCMALGVVLRDVLGVAQSMREAKRALATRRILVDGRVTTDMRRGVGVMDVLSVGDDHYRCILDGNGKLRYVPISAKDAGLKLCRVDGKTTIKGGVTQLNLHDGRNMLVDDANKYNTMDTLVVEVGSQKVKKHHKFETGANCYLIGGSHIGSTATMSEYVVKRSSKDNEVLFGDFGTIVDHVFVVGDASLPLDEVNA